MLTFIVAMFVIIAAFFSLGVAMCLSNIFERKADKYDWILAPLYLAFTGVCLYIIHGAITQGVVL